MQQRPARWRDSKLLWAVVLPCIFVLLWSGGPTAAKIGLRHAEPLTFLALRYAVLVALLALAFLFVRPPLPERPSEWGHQTVVGFFIQALFFTLTYYAFILGVSVGAFGVIISFQPILVGLFAKLAANEKVPGLRWLGLGVGMGGALLVISSTANIAGATLTGVLAAVGALAAMTIGTLYEKRFGSPLHPISSNLIQYAVGFLVCAPIALATERLSIDWTADFLWSLAYLVIANSLVSITLLLALIRAGEVSRVSAIFFLIPPTTAVIAWITIGEAMPSLAWAGMSIAVVGVILAGQASSLPRLGDGSIRKA